MEACLKTLAPGRRVLLWYSDDVVWHEALIGVVVTDKLAVIYTPDKDMYMEDLSCGDDGPRRVKNLGPKFALPKNLRARAYRFREQINNDLIKQVFVDAVKLAEGEGHRVRIPSHMIDAEDNVVEVSSLYGDAFPFDLPVAAVTKPGDASVGTPKNARLVRPAVGDSVWVAAEPVGGLLLGQEVSLNEETDVQCVDRVALAFRQGEYVKVEMIRVTDASSYADRRRELFAASATEAGSSGDRATGDGKKEDADGGEVRTLWVDYDEHGDRFKRWRDVVKESYSPSFEEKPLEGPSTGLHLIKHAERHGGDPRLWLQLWARTKHVEPTDRVHHELKVLTDCLYYAGTHDQLNIPALVSLEVVCRRIQAIVDAYSHASKPSWENARIFSGQGTPEDIVSPTFRSYAVKRNKEELELLQARQKVRELRGSAASEEIETADGLPSKTPKHPKAKAKSGAKGGGGQAEA